MTDQRFQYTALNGRGVKVHGAVSAGSTEIAAAMLRSEGLTPIRLQVAAASQGWRRGAVGRARLAEFLHALGMLVGAGATMTAALAIFRGQMSGGALARLSENLEKEIAGGRPASEAFRIALGGEAPFLPGLVAAGEASGDLAAALRGAADQLQRDGKLAEEFWSALSYPLFILGASVAAILVLLLFVIPSIAPLVAEARAQTPVVLRVLIAASDFTNAYGGLIVVLALIGSVAIAIGGALGLLRDPAERFLLEGPVGAIARQLVYGRFAGVLGRLLAAGVSAPDAFRLANGATNVRRAQRRMEAAATTIFDGARVSQALASCKGFPSTIVRMAVVGEETGALGDMIERGAQIEQDAAIRRLGGISKWLGPVMIALLGGMIGLVMAALLTGVASLGGSVLD
jgi:type II secretory pathway component PulF